MDHLEFVHIQTSDETLLLTALTKHILNQRRMAIWAGFSIALTFCLVLASGEENIHYGAPLIILSGILSLSALVLLGYSFYARPKLLNRIHLNEGITLRTRFYTDHFLIERPCGIKLQSNYRNLLGQYWAGDYYILHIRISPKCGGNGDELLIFPLTEETFDSIYALADALSSKKKRLVRLRLKNSQEAHSQ